MTTAQKPQLSLTVPAARAALAWLNAFAAAGKEKQRPLLHQTLAVEWFDLGCQFIGCNGHVLFRTWVPVELDTPWPDLDEAPVRSLVVMDLEGFGKAFMKALQRVTSQETHTSEELRLSLAEADDEATLALGEEFLTERLTLRACGQRIDLRLFEKPYPDWRRLKLGVEATERVDGMTIAARYLRLLGALKGVDAVDLDFHGKARSIDFLARGETEVRGLLMPMLRPEEKTKVTTE